MSFDKLASRIEEFALIDDRSRWSCVYQSAALSLAYALVSDLVLERPRGEIVVGIALIVGIYHSVYITRYCRQSARIESPAEIKDTTQWVTRLRFVRYVAASVGAVFIAASRTIQAEVVGYRLQTLSSGSITPRKLQAIDQLSRDGAALSLPVKRDDLKLAGIRIIQGLKEDKELAKVSAKALDSMMAYSSTLGSTTLASAFVADLERQSDAVPIMPTFDFIGPSPKVFGIGQIVPRKDKAKIRAFGTAEAIKDDTPGYQALFVIGLGVGQADVTTISIDRHVLKNVSFVNCRIVYKGGAIFIDRVCFQGCTFETEPNSALYYSFVQGVLGGDCVDFLVSPGGGNFIIP